ncbi:metalloregulator ArsR/SmtB family transcription factor [Pseudomonas piscis]|uniref:Metalloregulator ArsR/SmtB family transcription factor n=1 Tax=Pseudomonas piscis TaxID=2614538 RepID=A0ABY9NR38_9PSED|nr:metalloregulator ArsR/SmtB family transcription factor [Pseudomonas piscis]WMN20746.1 metalloregulator ArsR/SmtB family transcription factor [Pseudomonas piscis]
MTPEPIGDDERFLVEGAQKAATLLRAISNEYRLQVLCLLIEHGEITVGGLLQRITLSQSALSQHLAKMREEGLVAFRREAQTLYYRIDNPDVAKIIATLKTIYRP